MSLRSALVLGLCGLTFGCASDGTLIPTGPPCSVEGVTGALPGVAISIRASKCVFGVGESAVFSYEVVTSAAVPPISVSASVGCGSCRRYSADPLSFVDWMIGGTSRSGIEQQYCLCDTGCCAPDLARTVTVDAKTSAATISWSGHTWRGPSDTGQREGAAFLPGNYQVSVGFFGGTTGSVTARLPIEVR